MSMPVKIAAQAPQTQRPTYVGGGTDLMPLLKNHVRDDKELVFLNGVEELNGIWEEAGWITIGAGERLYDIANAPLLREKLPAVAQAAGATASPQIRNIATIGGNIMQDRRCIYFNQSRYWRKGLPLCFKTGGAVCHQIPNSPVCRAIYYSDVATALAVYEAQAEYIEAGVKKRGPILELVKRHSQANGLACGEHLPILVTSFRVPALAAGERSGFYKYAMRATIDFPLINFALRCGGDREAKLVAGAVAPWPVELPETAKLLNGPATDDEIAAACAAELQRLAMPIKEACIPPTLKRSLYQYVSYLLHLRREV